MSFWDVAKSVGKGVVKGGKWAIEHRKDISDVAHTGADLFSRVTAGKKHAVPAQEEIPVVDTETAQPAEPLQAVEARLAMTAREVAGLREDTDRRLLAAIIRNYNEDAVVIISTHLISDVESVLADVVFLKEGKVVLHQAADEIREEKGESVDKLFREVFKC